MWNISACLITQKQKTTKTQQILTKTALEDSCFPLLVTPFAQSKASKNTSQNARLMQNTSTYIH